MSEEEPKEAVEVPATEETPSEIAPVEPEPTEQEPLSVSIPQLNDPQEEPRVSETLEDSLLEFQPDEDSVDEDVDYSPTLQLQEDTVEDALHFKIVQPCEDRVHVTSLTEKLLASPPPEKSFVFANTDYEADPDALFLNLTAILTRTGTPDQEEDKDMVIERSPSPSEIVQETPFVEEPVVEQVPVEVIQPEPEPVVVEQKIDREDYVSKLKILLEQKEKLGARNAQLQNRLGEHFKRKRADDSRDGEKSVLDQEQRYASVMQSLSDYKAEAEAINSTNRRIVEENKAKLEERLLEAKAKTDEFNKYKRQISMSAENSRTGKALPLKIIEQLEATERKKESDVVAVRLENIKLRNKLRRHEQLLRQKEELADGLHLIDFEQLKIENQTFNEKIEERNEELLKLRKKITNVVQVLTHVKEKLQFVQAEATDLKATLKDVDKQVTAKRDLLPILKQSRDAIRNANTVLRQKNGLLGNSNLLRDYGNKVDSVRALNGRIEQLKGQYNDLTEETQRLRRKMQKNALVQQLKGEYMSVQQMA